MPLILIRHKRKNRAVIAVLSLMALFHLTSQLGSGIPLEGIPGSPQTSNTARKKKPLDKIWVMGILAAQDSSEHLALLVRQRGVDFEPTEEFLESLHTFGAEKSLLSALRNAKVSRIHFVAPS